VLGMADTEHDIVHVLHSLHTQGKVDFDERGNGMGTATYHNIRLHKRGSNRKVQAERHTFGTQVKAVPDSAPVEERRTEHTVGDLVNEANPLRLDNLDGTTSVTVTDLAVPEGYPLLDDLLERERQRLDADNKGMSYVVAAEAIQLIDPEAAAMLMEKAKALDIPFPSPIEQEYLRYVAANPEAKP